jgi:putative phosphoribosyl transferase
MHMQYKDRREAGKALARHLEEMQGDPNVIVLGIPRGGVVVAFEVARALEAPLDIYLTRKIGVPHNPELAIGAVASDGTVFVEHDIAARMGASPEYIEAEIQAQQDEIKRRLILYRRDRPAPELAERTIVLVDDGVATGATVMVALRSLRQHNPRKLILAVPVAPSDTVAKLRREADEVICPMTPRLFWAVSGFYQVFGQTQDDEVVRLLEQAAEERGKEKEPPDQD